MKRFNLLFSLIAPLAITASCSNEFSADGTGTDSGNQYLDVAVAVPQTGLMSRSVDEDDVSCIDIFMFDQSDGKFATVTHYDRENLQGPEDGYKGKEWTGEPVETTVGDKYIVAGVNLSAEMVEKMKELICKPDQLVMFEHTLAELTAGSQGVVMFSCTAEPLKTDHFYKSKREAIEGEPYTIDVDRSVAKLAVFEDNDIEIIGGGVYENLMFGWGNVNKTLAYIPKITVDGSEVTPDYGWASIEKYTPATSLPLYAQGADPDVFAYAQENLMPYSEQNEDKLTYMRITGAYIPEKFSYLQDDYIAQRDNDAQSPTTFYTLETREDLFYYFETKEAAELVLSAAGNGSVPEFKTEAGDGGILTYTDGKCRFNALINNEASGEKKNNIVRNTYYRILLKTLKAPGLPGEGPEPEGRQWIGFSVKVLDWIDVYEEVGV